MPPPQAGTKVAGKGIKYCVEGGSPAKAAAGRERKLPSKDPKHCVEGCGLPLKAAAGRERKLHSEDPKYCVEGGRPAKTAGREQMLLSKDTKHCVEGGRFIGNRRRLPKARGIGAEMSGGAGQSGQLCRGGRRGRPRIAAESPAPRLRGARPEKNSERKNRRKTPAALENMGLEPTAY